MPVVLLIAQALGVAQAPEFVAAILVTASLAPIQVYINEVFAPAAVRYNQHIGIRHGTEISLAVLVLTCWLAYRLEMEMFTALLVVVFAQGYVWLAYKSSRRVLEYQADSIIGGRYSYMIGAIVPLTFLLVVVADWMLSRLGWERGYFLYSLIVLPNAVQYLYTLFGWMAKERAHSRKVYKTNRTLGGHIQLLFFMAAMVMAAIAQHWKIALAETAVGFAALSIYMISPFSSIWLIFSRSNYMTKDRLPPSFVNFWISLFLAGLTLSLDVDGFGWVFLLALLTQILTFKFITDIRLKSILLVGSK